MRRRLPIPLLAALVAVATVSVVPVAAPAAAAQTRDVTIPGSGGVSLDGKVFLPETGTGHPLVVMPASWTVPKEEYDVIGNTLAGKGYVAVSYTTRGWFNSTGTITVAGPEDQADVSAVIDWALVNTPATSGRKVGMFGVSYGAGIGLLAASVEPRIGAVVALSGWTDLQTSMLPGDTVSSQAIGLLGTTAGITGRPDQLLLDALDAAETGDVDGLAPIAETRSPGRRVAQLNANRPALMVANGWQDGIFPADQFFDSWDRLTVPKRILLGPGDHFVSEAGGLFGLPSEFTDAGLAWLDRHLLGTAGPEFPAVQVRPTTGGTVRTYPSLSALRTGTRRLSLGVPDTAGATGASLTAAAPPAWSATYAGGRESGADTGAVLAAGIAYALGLPTTKWLPLIDRSAGLVWQTAPLTAATTLGGLPTVHARVTPSGRRATVFAYLYDVDAFGTGTLLSWQPWTARNLTPGRAVAADLRLQPVLATIPAGHRIALVLDSVEGRYRSETASGDTVTVSGSSATPSYLDLPLG